MMHTLRPLCWIIFLVLAKAVNLAGQPCNNYTFAGLVGGSANPTITSFCDAITPLPINQFTAPSGGSGGSAEYQWQISFNGLSWIDLNISDGRNQNLLLTTPQMVAFLVSIGYDDTQTTYFRRGVRRSGCVAYLYSNVREFRVFQQVDHPGFFPNEYVICAGNNNNCVATASFAMYQSVSYPINPVGGTMPYEFIWQMSANLSSWVTFSTEALPQICPPQGTRTHFRRGVRPLNSPCAYAYTNIIEVYHVRPLNIQLEIQHPECSNQTGSITLQDLSGNDPLVLGQFSYSINNGQTWQNSNVFDDLPPGNYTIIVNEYSTKCSGCHLYMPQCTVSGTISANPIPVIQSVYHTPHHNCDATDRVISITANGGSPPLQYSINGGEFQASPVFTGLSNGIYPIFVKNANGTCEQFGGFVTLNTSLKINLEFVESMHPSDCGVADGMVSIYANGGLAPLQYSINGIQFQTSPTFSGLAVGTYNLYIRNADATCQAFIQTVQLNGPPQNMLTNVSITHLTDCGSNDGALIITASPPVPNKVFTINGGNTWVTNHTFNNLADGVYIVGVKNQFGGPCAVYDTIEIGAPPPPVIS
ncbi:MAG: hypothetical protein SH848_04850, partial [Saprospiraceae bacterium]|nr:hypothetical protein [Saprospiraceae bacterium]MDZ4703233.1 hypothetical protein [Saprospiraceae bacterium]